MRLDAETTNSLNALKETQRLKNYQLELKQKELEQYLLLNKEESKCSD